MSELLTGLSFFTDGDGTIVERLLKNTPNGCLVLGLPLQVTDWPHSQLPVTRFSEKEFYHAQCGKCCWPVEFLSIWSE